MVDSKTIHNFVTETEAKFLNILWHSDTRETKVVNLVTLPNLGIAKRITIKMATWNGHDDFVIVTASCQGRSSYSNTKTFPYP